MYPGCIQQAQVIVYRKYSGNYNMDMLQSCTEKLETLRTDCRIHIEATLSSQPTYYKIYNQRVLAL